MKELTPTDLMEATQTIEDYYHSHGLNYNAIDWDNLPSWWPEELVKADETINEFYAQAPEGANL